MSERRDDKGRQRPSSKYRGEGNLGDARPAGAGAEVGDGEERDLEETLDRERHGSGEYDPEERYGRNDTEANRERAGPGDEEGADTAEEEPERGRSPRKQDPA
ncbi:MAG TPA: hypothetical protein VF168_07400 [Trueperaceae bacterium]